MITGTSGITLRKYGDVGRDADERRERDEAARSPAFRAQRQREQQARHEPGQPPDRFEIDDEAQRHADDDGGAR